MLFEDREGDLRRAFADLKARGSGWLTPFHASLKKLPEDLISRASKLGVR